MADLERWLVAAFLLASWIALWLWLVRPARQAPAVIASGDGLLVAYASQSGSAAALAERLAASRQGGADVQLLPLDALTAPLLQSCRRVLFVVSTYGDGEPPDNARRFANRYLHGRGIKAMPQLEYGVVAFGDSRYTQFCQFGRQLYQWLSGQGATSAGPIVEVDAAAGDDEPVLPSWLQQWWGIQPAPTQPSKLQPWQLVDRQRLNPGSPGLPLYLLRLRPLGPLPLWQAGDLFEIVPEHPPAVVSAWLKQHQLDGEQWLEVDGHGQRLAAWLASRQLATPPLNRDLQPWLAQLKRLAPRCYSIASLPREGELQLLVRLHQDRWGHPGLCSGWLGGQLPLKGSLMGRLRVNPSFHLPETDYPLLLIGTGSGLAGLRAHLVARANRHCRQGGWLIYGERSPQHDRPLQTELQQWQQQGVLTHIDYAYSRHEQRPLRVQAVLRQRGDRLQAWLDRGAIILVCGGQAMGQEVEQTLVELIGADAFEKLRTAGRYRRDLY